jgi:hypothetical protein
MARSKKVSISPIARHALDEISRLDTAASPASLNAAYWIGFNQRTIDLLLNASKEPSHNG